MKKMIPTAVSITDWSPYREIIYKCSKCGTEFRIYGVAEKFCHNCGQKVGWDKVMIELPRPFEKNAFTSYDAEKKLISKINEYQLEQNS